jgi:hypothetical protein
MARIEADREDLFAEARALVRRLELRWRDRNVVIGVRGAGDWSVYLSPDCVAGFNREGCLRRAYMDGSLYRAESGRRLTMLRRVREADRSVLLAAPLEEEATQALLAHWAAELRALSDDWSTARALVQRWSPEEDREAVEGEVERWLRERVAAGLRIADGM